MESFYKYLLNSREQEISIPENLEERLNTVNKIKQKYPDRVPVVICKSKNEKTLKDIGQTRYLVPKKVNIVDLLVVIRKKLDVTKHQAIFIFAGNSLIPMNTTMEEVYNQYHNGDGILYIFYSLENTFG